ncbi:hypothetical protein [Nocardia pneumoniae]|nr:hypothetical protein [Nocardia pneumoniae]
MLAERQARGDFDENSYLAGCAPRVLGIVDFALRRGHTTARP